MQYGNIFRNMTSDFSVLNLLTELKLDVLNEQVLFIGIPWHILLKLKKLLLTFWHLISEKTFRDSYLLTLFHCQWNIIIIHDLLSKGKIRQLSTPQGHQLTAYRKDEIMHWPYNLFWSTETYYRQHPSKMHKYAKIFSLSLSVSFLLFFLADSASIHCRYSTKPHIIFFSY